jgi:hypothetical protein
MAVVVNNFQTVIKDIRTKLRGEGIIGVESMRHICLYVMARYMTVERARDIGIPVEFAWESMMHILERDAGIQLVYDAFCNIARGDNFLRHLDKLLGTDNFAFQLKSITLHSEIMKAMNKVNLSAIDHEIDILGYMYERHIRTGAIPPRDLGQFFTDRIICKYMISMCNPHMKRDGTLETICDPSMGTGGFLTTAIKHYSSTCEAATSHSAIDWRKHIVAIHGCDIDSSVSAIARMNVFMETNGICAPNLLTQSSLYMGLPINQYDIILANIPFGVRQIEYDKCIKAVRDLGMKFTASEPLFLQLIMVSLARFGRAVVIVPSGLAGGREPAYIKLRAYFVANFDLHRVIELERGAFFMNTTVRTHILYFSKGASTGITRMYKLSRNTQDGTLCEKKILKVSYEEMEKRNFSWVAGHYIEQEVPPILSTRVRKCTIGDVCELIRCNQVSPRLFTDYGLAVIKHRNVVSGQLVISDEQAYVPAEDLGSEHIVPNIGDIVVVTAYDCGRIARVDDDGWVTSCDTYIIRTRDPARLNQMYLFQFLRDGSFYTHMQNCQCGSTVQHIHIDDISGAIILIPPIDDQLAVIDKCAVIQKRSDELYARIAEIEREIEINNAHRRHIAMSQNVDAPSPSS